MASYTTLDPADLQPGAPTTASKMNVLYSNPEGIAAGVAGAPRIQPIALQAPTAGDVIVRQFIGESSVFADPTTGVIRYYYGIICEGQIRARVEASRYGTGTHSIKILRERGGTTTALIDEEPDPGFGYTTYSVDIDVRPNDRIVFRMEEVLCKNMQIRCNNGFYLTGV